MLLPEMYYRQLPAGAEMAGCLGSGVLGKDSTSHLSWHPSTFCSCIPTLTILHVRNWFQKEAPSSKLKRTPPANKTNIFRRDAQTLGSQHHLKHPNPSPCAPYCLNLTGCSKGTSKSTKPTLLTAVRLLHCHIQGRQHLAEMHYPPSCLSPGQLGAGPGTLLEGSCSSLGRCQQLLSLKWEQSAPRSVSESRDTYPRGHQRQPRRQQQLQPTQSPSSQCLCGSTQRSGTAKGRQG